MLQVLHDGLEAVRLSEEAVGPLVVVEVVLKAEIDEMLVEDVKAETVAAVVELAYTVKIDVQVEDVVMLVELAEVDVRVEGDVVGVTVELLAEALVDVEKFVAAEIVVQGTEVVVLENAVVVQFDLTREREY